MSLFKSATDDSITFLQNDFASNSFPIFEDLKRSGTLCDVILKVGDRCFMAHKIILAGTIPYFKTMFTNGMEESKKEVISMKEINPDALELLIGFAYSGKVRISTSNVQSLLSVASYLQLTKVEEACCEFLKERLTSNNVLGIKSFADAVGCTTLVQATNDYIQMNFTETASNEEFNNLKIADFKEIISRDELRINSEEEVFEAVLSWVKSDTSRQKHLAELLMQVRMPLLTPQYLSDHVATEELIRSSLQCRDLLDEAVYYHLMPERRPLLRSFRTTPRCHLVMEHKSGKPLGNTNKQTTNKCCRLDTIGCIYVVGGFDRSGDFNRTVEMYDPKVAKWQMSQAMTVARRDAAVAVMHNKLYVIGGWNETGQLNTVEVFDPELRRWSTVASMNCKRSQTGAATLFNKLYVCGGYDGSSRLRTVESYDPVKNVWSMVTSMSTVRAWHGVVAVEDHIYALGGWDKSYSILDSVERYNPLTGQWASMPPMLTKRVGMGVATLNGCIYVCGGRDAPTYHQTAEVYNPSTKQWSYISSMNIVRYGVALVANCGKLFAIGGCDRTCTPQSSVEVYDPELNRWDLDLVESMCAHQGDVAAGVIPSL